MPQPSPQNPADEPPQETQQEFYFFGIDGDTGEYLTPPMTSAEIDSRLFDAPTFDDVRTRELVGVMQGRERANEEAWGLPVRGDGRQADLSNLSHTGWGIVFLSDECEDVKAALAPLIERRREEIRFLRAAAMESGVEAGEDVDYDEIVKVLTYPVTDPPYNWMDWLEDHDVAPGSVMPQQVPFYLLLVGDPARFSFALGHQLTTEYAVGRLHFETAAEYGAYVKSVLDYERADDAELTTAKEVVFFGPRHEGDKATELSADYLVTPLAQGEAEKKQKPLGERWGYSSRHFIGNAFKKDLQQLIAPHEGVKTPAFLFTASHGMGFRAGEARQAEKQGALLCQDWGGVGEITPAAYFSAADIPPQSRVHGMVIFHFACYSAGTPNHDRFLAGNGIPRILAPAPFIAQLPKKWLTHPNGGALACLGHIDRAWGFSIGRGKAGTHLLPFRNALDRILSGQRVGLAMLDFYARYSALATSLNALRQDRRQGFAGNTDTLALRHIECNDAEGYVLIGDPAVRIRAEDLR